MVFEALLAERNVTRAARRLALSQPALSHALARLRRDFRDDLFVRAGKGVTPTPRALAVAGEVAHAVASLQQLYGDGAAAFSPQAARGTITIATTDFFEQLLLPRLLPYLAQNAPEVTAIFRQTGGELPKAALENGTLDLAVAGFYGELPEGFHQRVFCDETYSCVVRREHPVVKGQLSLETFLKLGHLLVSPQGDLAGVVDRELAKRGLARRIVAGVSGFHTPAAVIAGSDLIVTIPTRLAQQLAMVYPLRCLPPPLPLPGFRLTGVWHERTHRDGQQLWVRGTIAKVLEGA